ncbi:general L-amino acid transport system permease protein [Amaricoccus macauensis]|uniref:General L-amino acid transport system permease protein n=1 Tax=Amaricoccus macauensis TaxID=57001 RepID=A0A840SSN3_9RHOB|nr:amino acid ABC transporter permease [Amaricoccus macauensis]MBB5223608.1 general L-amino acid transport system permease protein [Amaricoccus macauensis]
MDDVAWTRTEMLGPEAPPASAVGIVGWMRANLFSTWLNVILTVAALGAIWLLASHIVPFFAHSVWNASSYSECREIVARTWGEGASGACLAVIRERWKQFFFGFYPADYYWRPTLAFILMFVALAPVLFSSLPRKMLWFSAIFPGVAYWLLWGGSIFFPIAIYLGFVAGYVAFRVAERGPSFLPPLAAAVVTIVWWLFIAGPLANLLPDIGLPAVQSKQFGGFMLSMTIGVTGIAFSLPLGVLLALGRRSDMLFVKWISVGFIEFIRGVPLITLLLVASFLLNIFMPPGTNFDIILRVIIMVTLFAAAYMAEVIRGGLAALPRGQYEGADSLGLNYWQATRLVIMPQALKISIPGIVNTFIGLFKDTTLVAIIGLLDPVGLITSIRANSAWNGIVWELYGFVGFMFFICCFGMSRYSQYLERRLRTDRH